MLTAVIFAIVIKLIISMLSFAIRYIVVIFAWGCKVILNILTFPFTIWNK